MRPNKPYTTRRRLLMILGATPLAFGAFAGLRISGDLERQLRRTLAKWPLPFEGGFELRQFTALPEGRGARIVLRLNWPPGMRQRGFTVQSDTPEETLATLTAYIGYWVADLA